MSKSMVKLKEIQKRLKKRLHLVTVKRHALTARCSQIKNTPGDMFGGIFASCASSWAYWVIPEPIIWQI
jgi:hypothetical protein